MHLCLFYAVSAALARWLLSYGTTVSVGVPCANDQYLFPPGNPPAEGGASPLSSHNMLAKGHMSATRASGADDDAVRDSDERAIPSGSKEDGMVPVPQPPAPACWQKSKSSGSGNCVEVARVRDEVWIRDSKTPKEPLLRCTSAGWAIVLAGIRGDDFMSA